MRPITLAFLAALLLVACGGGGSSGSTTTTADSTAPRVSTFAVAGGAAIAPAGDGSYAVSSGIGSTERYTVTVSEKLAADNVTVQALDAGGHAVALPAGLTATLTATDASRTTYELTLATNANFVFAANADDQLVSLVGSLADSAGNSTRLAVQATIGNLAPTANVAMVDWFFTDNVGAGPMGKLNADGSSLSYPLVASDITNPVYSATATCFSANATPIPNCYDPIHSHWAIDTSATDPAGRAISYSFEIAAADVGTDEQLVANMRNTLGIDAAGRLSQTGVVGWCYDANGTNYFTVTVIATPSNGGKPLRRSFLFTVRDDG